MHPKVRTPYQINQSFNQSSYDLERISHMTTPSISTLIAQRKELDERIKAVRTTELENIEATVALLNEAITEFHKAGFTDCPYHTVHPTTQRKSTRKSFTRPNVLSDDEFNKFVRSTCYINQGVVMSIETGRPLDMARGPHGGNVYIIPDTRIDKGVRRTKESRVRAALRSA